MAKKAYVGVDDVARRVRKIYYGADGVAHRVRKGYIGIGGVARPWWTGGELSYFGTIDPLATRTHYLAAASNGKYAIFCGGYGSRRDGGGGDYGFKATAYDRSLTRTIAADMQGLYREHLAATSVGVYAVFGGGGGTAYVDAYNQALTRFTTLLFENKIHHAAATVGDYALFGGGHTDGGGVTDVVNYFNKSLSRGIAAPLSVARSDLAATPVGNYALFGGGSVSDAGNSILRATVDAYDRSLTRSSPAELSVERCELSATTIGNHALFGGGYGENTFGSGNYSDFVDSYDKSLTRSNPMPLSEARHWLAATTVCEYALFGGGYTTGDPFTTVDAYDESLIRSLPTPLRTGRRYHAATSIGDFALFGGGYGESIANTVNNTATVEAYMVG